MSQAPKHPSELTPTCPGCGYNLTGLEPPLDCPECGFAVPDHTTARMPRRAAGAGRTLQDPMWPAMLPLCPGCGYNLTGLGPPADCPECGFTVDDKTLVLRGVVKSDASQSTLRKVLWGVVIVVGVVLLYGLQALPLLIGHSFTLTLYLITILVWLAGFIAMLSTSKGDRAGRKAIVFTAGGFIAVPDLNSIEHEGQAVTWDRVTGVRLDRVSPVWYRLQVWSLSEKLLDAGVRCPDPDAQLVYDTLEAYRTGWSADTVMGTRSKHAGSEHEA